MDTHAAPHDCDYRPVFALGALHLCGLLLVCLLHAAFAAVSGLSKVRQQRLAVQLVTGETGQAPAVYKAVLATGAGFVLIVQVSNQGILAPERILTCKRHVGIECQSGRKTLP